MPWWAWFLLGMASAPVAWGVFCTLMVLLFMGG